MITLTLRDVATATGGRVVGASPETTITGDVRTDSRAVGAGDLFVAVVGERLDGHEYAAATIAAGAVAAVTSRELAGVAQVVVADTVVALSDLARLVVERVRAAGRLRVVAVTGSNGKTTTKNLVAAALEAQGESVAAAGSFNNEVGAPMTMLRITDATEYLVLEYGADGPGDLTKLVGVVMPDVAIVTTVGLAHVGKFGSREVTAATKSELVTDLPASATAILNLDDALVSAMASRTAAHVVGYGIDRAPGADRLVARDLQLTASGTTAEIVELTESGAEVVHTLRLRILGEHHIGNALAALAAVRALGVEVAAAITAIEALTRAERWRMEVLETADGITVINDAYNASPDSTLAALRTLATVTRGRARAIAVLGEMSELGDLADAAHEDVGLAVVRLNIDELVVVGEGAKRIHVAAVREGSRPGQARFVPDADTAYDVVRALAERGDVVLVKSSNSAGLRWLGDRIAGVTA